MNEKTMLSAYIPTERTLEEYFTVRVTAYVDEFNTKSFNYPKLNFNYILYLSG